MPEVILRVEPELEELHLTREECIAETWKGCWAVNQAFLLLFGCTVIQAGPKNGFPNNWGLLFEAFPGLSVIVAAVVWAVGGVICWFVPRDGRIVKRKVKTEEESKGESQSIVNFPGGVLGLFLVCGSIAAMMSWLFYVACTQWVGFQHKETVIACIAVFLLFYAGSAIAFSLRAHRLLLTEDEAAKY